MKFSFPEQRSKWDDSGFVNLEPCDLWAERYGCFNNGGSNDGGGSDPEPSGTVFGVDGRSVTGSTAQDAAIGYTDGQGGKGANYDALSGATSSDVQAAVNAAIEASRSGGDSISAAAGVLGGGGSDVYGIGRGGEFSTSARAPAGAPAAAAALTDSPVVDQSFNVSPPASRSQNLTREQQAIVETARARGETPPDFDKPMTVAEIAREEQLADIFREIGLDPAAGQEQERARQAAGQEFLDNFLGVTGAAQINADRILNQAAPTSTPIQVDDGTGVAAVRPGAGLGSFLSADGMTRQGSRITAPVTGNVDYGGYEDDPAYDADLFGTPRYAGGITGLDGKLQGFEDVTKMGDFAESATRGGILGKITDFGIIPNVVSMITGSTPQDMRRDSVQEFFESGAQYNPESGKMEIAAGPGTLKMGESGLVTYTGMPDSNYTGMYASLVNPPSSDGGGGSTTEDATDDVVADPCPVGYKLVNGVCEPDPAASQTTTVTASQAPVATTFQPYTQATPVGTINPFVLQPSQVRGFAMGGHVQGFANGGYTDTSSLAGLAEASGANTAAGQSISEAMAARNEPDSPSSQAVQTVVATPVSAAQETQTVMATPISNTQNQLNQQPLQNQRQNQDAVNAQGVNALNQQQQPQNQPGLAKTLLEGIGSIFEPVMSEPQASVPPVPTAAMPGTVGYTNATGQLQQNAPANVLNYSVTPDAPVQGIAGLQNVRQDGGFSIPSPEELRQSLGLPEDVPGAFSDFLSGLGTSIMGRQDTFQNLGQLGQSPNMYQGNTQRPFR